jgi:hypothetical protein
VAVPPLSSQFLMKAFTSRGSLVKIAVPNPGVSQEAVNVGRAASAGMAIVRMSAARTTAIDTTKMMRLMEATSFCREGGERSPP